MEKFSKIIENLQIDNYYKIKAEIEIIVQSDSEGEAGYLADSILSSLENMYNYTIENIEKTNDRIEDNKL